MKAKTKRMLAGMLSAAMLLSNMMYGEGSLTVYASSKDDMAAQEQQAVENVGGGVESGEVSNEETLEKKDTSTEENPSNEKESEDTKPSTEEGEGISSGSGSSEGTEAPAEGGSSGGTEDSEEGSSPGTADVPGEGSSSDGTEGSGEEKSPEGTQPPTDEEVPKEEDTECTHQEIRYVSKKDGTHEIVCEKCEVTLKTEDCTYEDEETVSGNTTVTASVCKYCGYVLEEPEEEGEAPALRADVATRASAHKRIAYFSFDDETKGFTGDGATATKQGSPSLSSDGWKGRALNLSGSQYLTVKADDGSSLLNGLEGITVSYFSKAEDANGWSLYAAQKAGKPTYGSENYLGIMDKPGSVAVESFVNGRGDTSCWPSVSGLSAEWRHVVVTFDASSASIYINGECKASETKNTSASLTTVLGDSSIIQIGKAEWGEEYYKGLIDEFSIYDYAMSADEISTLYDENFKDDDVPESDRKMLAHYTFKDIASANSITDGTAVSTGAKVPNTSTDTKGSYDAKVVNDGAELCEDGSALLLPGSANNSNPAYVEVPSEMFLDPNNNSRMIDTLTVNIWMKNISAAGDWVGVYVGTDASKNSGNNIRPLNYLLLNPRKHEDKFKATMTRNYDVRSDPYNGEQTITEGATASAWQMYTVVVGTNTMTTYLDGQKVNSQRHSMKMSEWTADGTSAVPDILAYIGKGGYTTDGLWNGAVKECSFYNYQLTADEIDKLFQDGLKTDEPVDPKMLAHYTFADMADYAGNASLIEKGGKVSAGAVVPNTSADTKDDQSYNAKIVGNGALLRAGGVGLELPGGEGDRSTAYVELPTEMFTDDKGIMRDTLSINIWLQNISGGGDWTGVYVGTDPAQNQNDVPLNYLLLNPRKDNQFKVAMTHNAAKTGAPYNGEDLNVNGATDDWWQMYTVVVNANFVTTYLDGKKLATVPHTMKMSEWTDGTNENGIPKLMASIGAGGYLNDARWRGAVKECSIYNYELTQDTITNLYNDIHKEDESAEALVKATGVSTDFLGAGSAAIQFGESYELPSKTTVTLSDGNSNNAYVAWYDQNGNKVTDTSLLEAGTYNLTGKLENYFPAPFIEERADPQVYYDEASKKYYFTSSWPAYGSKESGYDKIVIRQSDTLVGLANAQEHTIWTAPGGKYPEGKYHIWAPELHHIGSKWYCYFAGTLSGDWDIRPRVLVCDDSKDITVADNWTEHERFMNKDGKDEGVSNAFSLDMTYFENNGKHYVIWAYKSPGSMLLMGEVDPDDPTKLTGDPMVLTYPEYAWECDGNQNVDEGPAVLKKNNRVYVAFSAAATGDMYCMGMISAPADSDLMDITNWEKCPTPVLQTKDLKGQYGPGHNSFTVDEDGNAILVYHARDEKCHNKQCGYSNSDPLYDPCRDAMLAYVRYAADGTPVFNSTADKELASLDTSQLKYTLTVETTMTEADPVASYALATDATDSVSAHKGTLHGGEAAFDNGLILSGTETGNLANYLDISDNAELLSKLENAKDITITAWVRNDTENTNNNNRPTIFSIGHDEKNYFAFSTGNWAKARASFYMNGKEVGDADGLTRIQYNTPGMQDSIRGDWYPVAITMTDRSSEGKSETRVRYYMNDKLVCTVDTPASIKDLGGLAQFYIGGGNGDYHDMYGGIRNVKIYDKALPSDLITKYDVDYLVDNLALTVGADLKTHAIETGDSLKLPLTGHPGVTYSWKSSDTNIMGDDGVITPSDTERSLTLTAVIKTTLDSNYTETVTFPVTVLDKYSYWLAEVYKTLTIQNMDDVRGSLYLPLESDQFPEVKISWKSGNPAIISDEEKNGIAPGIVTRPNADTDVKLTATISVGEGANLKTKTKEFTAKVRQKAQVGEFTDYMFAYFIGEGTKTGEQMYFADSQDGLHWTALNGGAPVMTSSLGEKGLRDPFIMRSHEGDKFYLIATDLWIAGGTSWGDSQTKGSQSIMVWESTDLVNWSDQRMCKVAVDDAGCTWAPEAFWDEETQDYAVFWASKTARDNYGPHHIWKCHTRDFYTYSEPEIWITLKNESGVDISVIDTTVIKAGDTYYRFNKNEDGGKAVMTDGSTVNTKVVYMEKSSSLGGTWEYVPSDYLLDGDNQYREGATSFKFNDDDVETDTWCLLLDNFGGGGYYPAVSTDLGSGSFRKLEKSEYSFPTEGILRHGSVLNITADEYAALEKKWGPYVEEEEPPTTTLEEACIASFTFDDEDTGFSGSGAVAEKKSANEGTITLSDEVRTGASGKSARFGKGGWLDVKTSASESLLTGVESMSISYYSKAEDPDKDGAGWVFFAAPNANAPVYNSSENYLGILDHIGEVKAERYHGTRSSATSTSTLANSLENKWRHVVVSYTPKSVKIYIDGVLKASVSKKQLSALPDLLGESSILQLGKGNWGSGEYYNGYIDDVTIYNRALTQEEVTAIFSGEAPGPDEPTEYTVTFDPDGGTLAGETSIIVEEGNKITKPEDPTKDGCTFLGWSQTRNGMAYWNFETDTVKMDMTLYACWQRTGVTSYTVTYDPDGGILAWASSVRAEEGAKIEKPADPTKKGFTFLGWSQTKGGTAYWDFDNHTVMGDMTLYACWKSDNEPQPPTPEVSYTVIFDPDGGILAGMPSVTVKKDEKITKPENPTREKHKFLGWSQTKDGKQYWNFDNAVKGNMTLYACWMELGDVLPGDVLEGDETNEAFIPNGLWIAGINGGEEGFTYTGKAVKPEVRVYSYKTLLKEKTDYTISYKNNVNASDTAPTITVKGKGNYTGQDTKTFKILPKSVEDADVSAENISVMYKKNKTQKPAPVVKWDNKKLSKKDIKVEYPDAEAGAYQRPGEWKIKVTGAGNYTGTKEITLYIADENAKLTSKLGVKKIPNEKYTGTAITPAVEVKDGRTLLEPGKHYDVSYENNTEVGTATVIITGKTDLTEDGKDPEFSYVGEKRVTFNIVGINLGKAKVTGGLETSYEYTGEAITPVPVLTDTTNGVSKELEVNKDYTVKYTNNRNVGTATITLTGTGAYTSTLKKTFKIVAFDMSADESGNVKIADIGQAPYAKGGSKPKPEVTYRMPNGVAVILREGVDYALSYKNNAKLNDCSGSDHSKWPTVTVKGKGNYKGTKIAAYKIVPQDISKLTVQAADILVSTKPNKYQSAPKVIDLDGRALKSGTDYERTFEYVRLEEKILENGDIIIADTPIGDTELLPADTTVKVTVKAKENGNYTGEVFGTYRITEKSISKASVKVKDQIYTGYEIRPEAMEITQIRVGNDDLTAGKDYEIIGYSNNIKKGTAKMTIRGLGEYGGTKTVSFKIKAKGFRWWDSVNE